MSDQPAHSEPRTFWYQCPHGHVEERPLDHGEGPVLRCGARIVRTHAEGGIFQTLCGEELRLFGPTVGEWRAINDALVDARWAARAEVAHRDRLLSEADRALAECSTQLDAALSGEGTFHAQVDATVHDLDQARAEAADWLRRLTTLRDFLREEWLRADEKGRNKLATRIYEARLASWTTSEKLAQEQAFAAELAADPVVSDVEMRRTEGGEEEVFYKPTQPEVATIVDGRLVTLLGDPFGEWQAAIHEVRRHARRSGDDSGPALLFSAVAELRELREWKRVRDRRGAGAFTLVRDVNEQTEAALKRAERELRTLRGERLNAGHQAAHWKSIALHAASTGPLCLAPDREMALSQIEAAYEGDMEADER